MLEKQIEKKVNDYATSKGWYVLKNDAYLKKGIPDRLYIKGKLCFFIEFKTEKGKTSKVQDLRIRELREKDIRVFVINNVEDGKKLINFLDYAL